MEVPFARESGSANADKGAFVNKVRWGARLIPLGLVGVAAAVACSNGSTSSATGASRGTGEGTGGGADSGSISLKLTLPGGDVINSVQYTLTQSAGPIQSGTVSVANSASIDFQLGSISSGSGYTLSLSATTTDGQTQCFGTAGPFSIVPRQTVQELVQMICTTDASSNGNVYVEAGVAYDCPVWQSLSTAGPGIDAGPFTGSEVNVGSTIDLLATANGPVSSELGYSWSTSQPIGLFGPNMPNGTTDTTTFTCTSPGTTVLTLVVSDGPVPEGGACPTSLTTGAILVECDPLPCNTASDCPGQSTGCETQACVAGTCTLSFAPAGTLAPMQTVGSCHDNVCDGAGNTTTVVDNTNTPVVPGCQSGACVAGQPVVLPLAEGAACATSPGMVCNGQGSCVQCNFASDCNEPTTACAQPACVANACVMSYAPELTACSFSGGTVCDGVGDCVPVSFGVTRIGTGAAWSGLYTAASVFVERRGIDGTALGSVSLPTSASGTNNPLTLTASAISEGALARSVDGRFLTLAGYAAAPGVATVYAAPVNRVVAKINAATMVDTSTLVSPQYAFSGQNVRGAASQDGSEFWVSGLGGGSTGGIVYVPLGNPAATPPSVLTMNQFRAVGIFGGMLFGDGESSGTAVTPPEVFEIGTGLPTSGSPALNELPGLPVAGGASPWQFAFFDLSASVPGLDTLYIANDKAVAAGTTTYPNGIQKWVSNGSTWSYYGTMNALTTAPTPSGFRGLGGIAQGQTVTLMATTVDTGSTFNRLAVFVDPNAFVSNYTTATPPTGTVVVTAPANELYRGVAYWPHP